MSVHYKFKTSLEYDTLTFDGLHISVADLKAAIFQQKRIGKTSDFDLQITNAQTKEVYSDNNTLVPKNTSLLVARVPLAQKSKKTWDGAGSAATPIASAKLADGASAAKGSADLSRMEGSEEDKIMAMMSQSTLEYDPSNYQTFRGSNQRGEVPPNYRCYKCHESGHWIKDCPLGTTVESVEIKRSTGIPRSFMVPVEGPTAPGAMITPTGVYAVPAIDHEAYQASDSGVDQPSAPSEPRKDIPEDLLCSLCKDLLTDAVMIPCCGSSFCDECLRSALLESEDHECPDCRDKEISPSTLIPNRFLRNSVATFRNQTGYIPKPRPQPPPKAPSVTEEVSPEIPEEPENPPEATSTSQEDHKSDSPPAQKSKEDTCDDSDGSYEDNITITVPPMQPANVRQHQSQAYSNGSKPSPLQSLSNHSPIYQHQYAPHGAVIKTITSRATGLDASPLSQTSDRGSSATPTVDERKIHAHTRRIPHSGIPHQIPTSRPEYRGQPSTYPPPQRGPIPPTYNAYGHNPPLAPYPGVPVVAYRPPNFLPQSVGPQMIPHQGPLPTSVVEDPLEAFERMIRQKEELARLRDKRSRSRSIHSRSRSRSISRSRSRYTRSRSRSRIRSRGSFSRSRSRPTSIRSPLRRPLDKYRRSFSRSPIMRRPIRERSKSFSRSRSRSIGPVRDGPIRRRTPPPRPYRSPVNRLRSSPRPRYNNMPPHKRGPDSRSLRSPPFSQGPPPLMDPHHRYGPPPVNPVVNPVQVPPALDGDKIRYDTPFEDGPPGAQPPPPGEQSPIGKKDDIGPPGISEREKDRPSPFRDQHNFRDSRPIRENRDSFPDVRDIPPVGRDEFRDHPPPISRDGPIPMSRDPGFIRDGRPPMYREGPPAFRDNHPNDFRDNHPNNFRDGPQGYRDNMSFRNGPPAGYRENIPPQGAYRDRLPPGNFRDVNVHPPNYRDGGPPFRDEPERYRDGQNIYREHFRDVHKDRPDRDGAFRDNHPHNREPYIHNREGYQQNRDAPHRDQFRNRNDNTRPHHDRGGRDYPRHDFNKPERFRDRENRDFRDPDKREKDYDRGREDRSREYEIHEKDKKHGSHHSPERKRHSISPKRETRDERTRHRRADSRSKTRKSPDGKKDTKNVEKSKVDDEKIKEKDKKEKKKKKIEKKKKKEKREKKEKDVQKEEHSHSNIDVVKKSSTDSQGEIKEEKPIQDDSVSELYNDSVGDVEIDKDVLTNYVVENVSNNDLEDEKETSFDGIELDANDLDLKSELLETGDKNKSEVLAPMPELSKWEIDDDQTSGNERKEPGEIDSPDKSGKVTSEVLKRAENAIFAKAINAIRPIEIKRISSDRAKLYSGELEEGQIIDKDDNIVDNIQITIPTNTDLRSVEINDNKKLLEKTPPKLSVKERLGCKVEEPKRKPRELHSTVERIRSRSRTPQGRRVEREPQRDPQRRVMIDSSRDRGRRYVTKIAGADSKNEYRISSRPERSTEEVPHHRSRDVVKSWSPPKEERIKEERKRERNVSISCSPDRKVRKKERKVSKKDREDKPERNVNIDSNKNLKITNVSEPKDQGKSKERERKKSTLDEANFEPDYDENIVETDNEGKEVEQRPDLVSKESGVDQAQTIELNLANVRMKPKSDVSSSSEDSSSSSSSSDSKKKRRKKRKAKKKKGKHYSESGSESDSSSDEPKKKKRKHKHKKKSSKKKKKPKHKSR